MWAQQIAARQLYITTVYNTTLLLFSQYYFVAKG